MLKRLLLTFMILTGLGAFASENYLNSVVIQTVDNSTSVVLRSDAVAKIKTKSESADRIVITLSGITQSPDINTLYKNISDVDGFAIQNDGNNGLKIYIDAPNISKADIIFETPNSTPIAVNKDMGEKKAAWVVVSLALLLLIMRSAKTQKPVALPDVNEVIKEREKALYRNFQREVSTLPSMNYRLKSYSKHVLKGETIRSYENRTSTKV